MVSEHVTPPVNVAVCGAQAPFMRGGAEMLMENLVSAFNAAGHRAELVRLPVAWDRARIFDAALAWRMVPINADIVVATNFPSYYARHPHKVVWLLHQHRVAYDAADTEWSDIADDDESLETQRLLYEWDTRVLEEATALYAVSDVVAQRLRRFNGLDAPVLHHPPPLHDRLHDGPFGDYVFAPMRLERNKRPDLVVGALAQWNPTIRAVLTGPGSMEEMLRRSAERDRAADRLEIRGHIGEEEMVDAFAGALAVVYVPFEEDYGYVTLQAFLAGKPVITSSDAGAVLEWVEDGVNGLVTDGTPEGIAAAVDRLAADRRLAGELGAAGRDRVAGLRWSDVTRTLVQAAMDARSAHA